ncbi:MAG TPA: YbdD/YjiX family protein [Candidatus Acidoferrales bacterium]|nr:YbdD/YjiX family protein [Candidatus Acidoferrales bacterium]
MAKINCALINAMRLAWWSLRQITGDAAYEIYLAHYRASRQEPNAPGMTRQEFYADSLRRRYSTISRCC